MEWGVQQNDSLADGYTRTVVCEERFTGLRTTSTQGLCSARGGGRLACACVCVCVGVCLCVLVENGRACVRSVQGESAMLAAGSTALSILSLSRIASAFAQTRTAGLDWCASTQVARAGGE